MYSTYLLNMYLNRNFLSMIFPSYIIACLLLYIACLAILSVEFTNMYLYSLFVIFLKRIVQAHHILLCKKMYS